MNSIFLKLLQEVKIQAENQKRLKSSFVIDLTASVHRVHLGSAESAAWCEGSEM